MTALNRITATDFPPQGPLAGRRVDVVLAYTQRTRGQVVRQDAEYPDVTIIRLDDGRFVLGGECQFRGAIG